MKHGHRSEKSVIQNKYDREWEQDMGRGEWGKRLIGSQILISGRLKDIV